MSNAQTNACCVYLLQQLASAVQTTNSIIQNTDTQITQSFEGDEQSRRIALFNTAVNALNDIALNTFTSLQGRFCSQQCCQQAALSTTQIWEADLSLIAATVLNGAFVSTPQGSSQLDNLVNQYVAQSVLQLQAVVTISCGKCGGKWKDQGACAESSSSSSSEHSRKCGCSGHKKN